MDRFTHSSAPVKKVQAVQFGVLDPDFIVSTAGDYVIQTTSVSLHTAHTTRSNSLPIPCSGGTLLSRLRLAKHMKRENPSLGA